MLFHQRIPIFLASVSSNVAHLFFFAHIVFIYLYVQNLKIKIVPHKSLLGWVESKGQRSRSYGRSMGFRKKKDLEQTSIQI